MEQEKVKEKKADDFEHCLDCTVANAKKKGSKCWWHTAKSRDWPIADNSGLTPV
jgi:hypothetical protein